MLYWELVKVFQTLVDEFSMRVSIIVCLFLLAGCERNGDMSLNLKHLIKTSYKKPTDKCQELGKVSGFTLNKLGFTKSYEQALNSILKETHAKGGNFLFITRASLDGTNLDGVSYFCNEPEKVVSQLESDE